MTAAKNSFGAQLWMITAGGTLAQVAEINVVSPPKLTRGTIDATAHDSAGGAAEFIEEGVYDAGEISFEGHYVANSAGDTAMMTAMTSGAKQDFKIVEKGAAGLIKTTGSGYLTAYGPNPHEVRGKQTFDGSIKITGPITKASNT